MSFRRFRRRALRDPAELRVPDTSGVNFPERELASPRSGAPQSFGATWKVPRTELPFLIAGYGAASPMQTTVYRRVRKAVAQPHPVPLPFAPLQAPSRLFNVVPAPSRDVSFCVARTVRRQVLFARRVAGYRRSPGRGGTYHRRPESSVRC